MALKIVWEMKNFHGGIVASGEIISSGKEGFMRSMERVHQDVQMKGAPPLNPPIITTVITVTAFPDVYLTIVDVI